MKVVNERYLKKKLKNSVNVPIAKENNLTSKRLPSKNTRFFGQNPGAQKILKVTNWFDQSLDIECEENRVEFLHHPLNPTQSTYNRITKSRGDIKTKYQLTTPEETYEQLIKMRLGNLHLPRKERLPILIQANSKMNFCFSAKIPTKSILARIKPNPLA